MTVAIEIIGWIGAALILVAYLMLSAGRLPARSVAYQGMNFVGAICFVANSGWNGAVPSATLNVIWALIALSVLVHLPVRE